MTDRVSAYELASQTYRNRMLAIDATALDAVTERYKPIADDLAKQIALLEKELAGVDSPSKLYRIKRYRQLLTQVEEQMGVLVRDVGAIIVDGQQTLVGIAQDEVQTLAIAQAADTSTLLAESVTSNFTRLNSRAFNALVGSLSDGSPLADYLAGLPDVFGKVIETELLKGIALGKHPRAISALLNERLYGGVARLLISTRSIMLDSYRAANHQVALENLDILEDEWIWQSSQDQRACLACIALDGTKHPISEGFNRMHLGCRCSQRYSVIGASPSKRETGQQWFDRQPDSVKREMLPKYAFDPVKNGTIQLKDFIHLDKDERWGDRYRQGSARGKVSKAA